MAETVTRLVGMVRRTSVLTDEPNDEGTLTTQLQRMRALLAFKNETLGERWEEVGFYDLQVVSGKDSLRTPEFQRLLDDVRAGRINTILCTELSRVCRNVREFLDLLEILKQHDVKFASIKEQFDTTTTFGVFVLTILMALAQFEREQTAERTSDSMRARAQRGLWNGGQLFGFDLDPDRKGYLVPNEDELTGMDLALDAVLEHGTIASAVVALNSSGYRTKSYTSRRGAFHPGHEFTFTTVQHMLKNPAYIGKKLVRGSDGERLVDAVWPAVVDVEKWERVQALIGANARSRHAVAKPIRHTYVLSGLLFCCCGSAMEGRSGTGRLGKKYFYYACRNKQCGQRVAADELETTALKRLETLASEPGLVEALTAEANRRIRSKLPVLRKRRASMVRLLTGVRANAERYLSEWASLTDEDARTFATESLSALARQREDLERGLAEAESEIAELDSAVMSSTAIQSALGRVLEVYEALLPHERKELVRLLLQRAEVSERRIVLEIRAGLEELPGPLAISDKSGSRSERPGWLPDEDSNLEPSG